MTLPEETIKQDLGAHSAKLSTLELLNLQKKYGIFISAIVSRPKACSIINDYYKKVLFAATKNKLEKTMSL